jgi:repressor LexA
MTEKQTISNRPIRPTRKQKVILDYVESYIAEHGYSPSYREVMVALNYKSVASVASHINNLTRRGLLSKRDYSARSIDVVNSNEPTKLTSNEVRPAEEKWLIEKIEHAFKQVEEQVNQLTESSLDHLYVLVGALKVLGLEAAAQSFTPRLNNLKQKQKTSA